MTTRPFSNPVQSIETDLPKINSLLKELEGLMTIDVNIDRNLEVLKIMADDCDPNSDDARDMDDQFEDLADQTHDLRRKLKLLKNVYVDLASMVQMLD